MNWGHFDENNVFEKSLTIPNKTGRVRFGIFQHAFCRKTLEKFEETLWGIFFEKKSHNAENTQRSDPVVSSRIVCYAEKKENFFGSLPWVNRYNIIFCRTFGRTILITSGVSKTRRERLKSAPYPRLKKRKTLFLKKNFLSKEVA